MVVAAAAAAAVVVVVVVAAAAAAAVAVRLQFMLEMCVPMIFGKFSLLVNVDGLLACMCMQISWDTTWQQLKDAFADYDVSHVDTGEVGFRDSVGCGTDAVEVIVAAVVHHFVVVAECVGSAVDEAAAQCSGIVFLCAGVLEAFLVQQPLAYCLVFHSFPSAKIPGEFE